MIHFHPDKTITFSIFDQFPQLTCILSTRSLGPIDIRKRIFPSDRAQDFLKVWNNSIISMEQVHKGAIQKVTPADKGSSIMSVDGIYTHEKDTYLSVSFADCVPVFFYDPSKKIIGVVHSGWGGTYENIVNSLIQQCKNMGSRTEDIYCAIGPHIGGCCYEISPDLAEKFVKLFPNSSTICFQNHRTWFLDLGQAVRHQLLDAEVLPGHIDTTIVCTSCQNDRYFSYRKNKGTSLYGQMIGIMGMRA